MRDKDRGREESGHGASRSTGSGPNGRRERGAGVEGEVSAPIE